MKSFSMLSLSDTLGTCQRTAVRRPSYLNHYCHGEEGYLKIEVGQSRRFIRHSGGDDQGSR